MLPSPFDEGLYLSVVDKAVGTPFFERGCDSCNSRGREDGQNGGKYCLGMHDDGGSWVG
jgi:hypothetical protein